MEQKHIIAAASSYLRVGAFHQKLLFDKRLFPIGSNIGFLSSDTEIQVKFQDSHGGLVLAEEVKIELVKSEYCLRMIADKFESARRCLEGSDYLFIVFEGSKERSTAILCFYRRDNAPFEAVEKENPTLRLSACDLPPAQIIAIEVSAVKFALYRTLAKSNPDLFSINAQRFLSTPHILTHLFAHVMSLASSDNISYISTLRVLAGQLRQLLKTRIVKMEKNHNKLWSTYYGERVGFLDGGMSRIVGLPGTEPMGIRVGIYSVIPGEKDLEKRESWTLRSYVIGDVVNDRSSIKEQNARTDTKRLQEASRYILEPLNALLYANSLEGQSLRLLLLHGPLQNSFTAYDEIEPSYVPSVDKQFLATVDIHEEDILSSIQDIPHGSDGKPLWNACIPIYLHIMKRLWSSRVPIAGVIERARSASFALRLIATLAEEETLLHSTAKKLKESILRHEIGDELLFGCILEEGEYISPIEFPKNFKHRAHEHWQAVVDQFPTPFATMLKCSATNFPYRVEMPSCPVAAELETQMSLLYHMSLLLPNYAFPVGIDIADKYVKIPDWLSKGVSETLTAAVLKKILRSGDVRTLMQVRRLLALTPRDFFFRPKA